VVPGVEEDDIDAGLDRRREVDDDGVGHGGRDRHPGAERLHRPRDHLVGGRIGEIIRRLGGEPLHPDRFLPALRYGQVTLVVPGHGGTHEITPVPAKRSRKVRMQLRQRHSPSCSWGSRSSSPQ
jgi:hypothetical protein